MRSRGRLNFEIHVSPFIVLNETRSIIRLSHAVIRTANFTRMTLSSSSGVHHTRGTDISVHIQTHTHKYLKENSIFTI